MLSNYRLTKLGPIEQINKIPYVYDKEYVDVRYNTPIAKEKGALLNSLRLGFINGSCGNINTILDVGYGNGTFLETCKGLIPGLHGYDVTDVQVPDGVLRVDSLVDRYYDCITFFDSLEHIAELSFFSYLQCNNIVISVPYCHWYDDSDDDWFEQNYKHRRENEHYWHFNEFTLQTFMAINGFYPRVKNSHIEDLVRTPYENRQNILTACYTRK